MQDFQKDGYLHLKSIVPEAVLELAKKPFCDWVDSKVKEWKSEGLIDSLYLDLDWNKRLNVAWNAAGKPLYNRSPRKEVVCEETFKFLGETTFVQIAKDLIGSENIASHGIFNCRPKLSDQLYTDTPWHQDAQYFPASKDSNIITMWVPLVDVTEEKSCLMIAPGRHTDKLHDNYEDVTGFIGLSPEVSETLKGKAIPMKKGDVLCFNQKMPHRALSNRTDEVRWSFDMRFEEVGAQNSSA